MVFLWFALVTAAVVLAASLGYERLSRELRSEVDAQMDSKLDHVVDVLSAADSTYSRLVKASLLMLRSAALRHGNPNVRGTVDVRGQIVPSLYFGDTPVTQDYGIVDGVTQLMDSTATLFVRDGTRFFLVSTNLRKDDGDRAVGTELDPRSKEAEQLRRGKAFYGIVDIFGRPYITGYEPILDANGDIVGVYYVGYAIDTLSAIEEALNERRVLDHGFFAFLDERDGVIFRTHNIPRGSEAERIAQRAARGEPIDKRWVVRKITYEPWDYDVVSAMYLPDLRRITVHLLWQVYGLGGIVIVAVLLASYWLASRLSGALASAEESKQEALEARDAAEMANRTKSTFLANMSHELRTPMNAIIGYSEMLIEDAEDLGARQIVPDLQKIRSAGKHLLALINDVLDLSKIEAGKMTLYVEEFSVREMLDEVAATIQPLLEKNGNRLQIRAAENLGTLRADLTKVRQMLYNLLSNASKFTQKGFVSIDASRVMTPSGERMLIRISDTGIGMTEIQLRKVFQAFTQADASTTRKFGGTGLGLVISRKFCEMMGGSIQAESASGKGSTFTVDLPVEVAMPGRDSQQVEAAPTATEKGKRVLVIDDEPEAAGLIRRGLEHSGFDVAVAHSGAEGIEAARKLRPDAITLDVMMPDMDGWSVLTALKNDPATALVPVVMVTMLQDRQRGFALGAAEFLTKPVDYEKLRDALIKHCGVPQSTVLVVEDDPANREMFRRILQRERYVVVEAQNGSAATRLLEKVTPALVLLDLMMPVMDGFEFLRVLRSDEQHASIPVIVITAKDLTPADRERLNGSVYEIIQKGAMNREKLLRDVCNMLERHAQRATANLE